MHSYMIYGVDRNPEFGCKYDVTPISIYTEITHIYYHLRPALNILIISSVLIAEHRT